MRAMMQISHWIGVSFGALVRSAADMAANIHGVRCLWSCVPSPSGRGCRDQVALLPLGRVSRVSGQTTRTPHSEHSEAQNERAGKAHTEERSLDRVAQDRSPHRYRTEGQPLARLLSARAFSLRHTAQLS